MRATKQPQYLPFDDQPFLSDPVVVLGATTVRRTMDQDGVFLMLKMCNGCSHNKVCERGSPGPSLSSSFDILSHRVSPAGTDPRRLFFVVVVA